ncbi:MAG: hypothetical protein FJ271_07870 [Planctomycetes bacterium]|nr:hypothetical protein [Planctomycetota bacterium]
MRHTWLVLAVLVVVPIQVRADGLKVTLLNTLGQREQAPAWSHTAQFSPDGKLAVVAGALPAETAEGTITVWDLEQGKVKHDWKIPGFEVTGLGISADGKLAIVALGSLSKEGKQRGVITLWDLETTRKLRDLEDSDSITWAVAISPDKKHALAGARGELKLWSLATGKLVKSWKGHGNNEIWTVGFRNDSEAISAGDDNRLVFWDLDGKQLRAFNKHGALSYSLSEGGKALATLARDQTIKIWDLAGKEKRTLKKETHDNGVGTVALTPDGRRCLAVQQYTDPVTVGEASAITMWDADTGKELWSHRHPIKGLAPILLTADGKQALVGGGANAFSLWDLDKGRLLRTFGGHKGAITSVAVDERGSIFSASLDGTLKRWDADGRELFTYVGHSGPINAMALRRNGQVALTGSSDKTMKLWDAASGKELAVFKGHEGSVTCVALSPGGKLALSGSEDRTVKLWNAQTGRVLRTLRGHGDRVNAVAFSPTGGWVASAADDNTIRLWPLKKRDDVEPRVFEDHKRQVTCLAFSRDGKELLSGSQDQTIKVWDVAEGSVLRTLEGHKNWVTGLSFPRAKLAASAADDLTVRLWNPASGKELGRIDIGTQGEVGRCLAFAPDGSTLAVGTAGWVIFRYGLK